MDELDALLTARANSGVAPKPYVYSEEPLTPAEEALYANAPRIETSGVAAESDPLDALLGARAEGKLQSDTPTDDRSLRGFVNFATAQPFEAADAFGHHAMNAFHGAAQFIENGLAAGAEKLLPDSTMARALRENADRTNKDLATWEAEYQQKQPDGPGTFAGATVGEVVPFLKGGGSVGRGIALIPEKIGAQFGKVGKLVGDVAGRTVSGATQGGVFSAFSPVTDESAPYWDQKTGQLATGVMVGGGLGGVVGAGVPLASAVAKVAEPFAKTGRDRIVGRFLADNMANPNAAVAGVRNIPEYVSGSRATTAQALGDDRLLSVERTLKDAPPYSNLYHDLEKQNNAARVNALTEVAGEDGKLAFYTTERDAVANEMYRKALAKGVNPRAITPEVQSEIGDLVKRPSIQRAMNDAKRLAAEEGLELTESTSLQGLHYTKIALDEQIAEATAKGNTNLVRLLMGTKTKLENVLNRLSPDYAAARATFAEMSKPINQMEQAQKVSGKLASAPQDASGVPILTRAQFQKGLNQVDRSVMTPEQLSILDSIMADLHRADRTVQAHKPTGSPTAQNLTNLDYVNSMLGKAPLLRRIPLVAGWGKDAVESAGNELQKRLAQALINPELAGNLIADRDKLQMMARLLATHPSLLQSAPQGAAYIANLPNR